MPWIVKTVENSAENSRDPETAEFFETPGNEVAVLLDFCTDSAYGYISAHELRISFTILR